MSQPNEGSPLVQAVRMQPRQVALRYLLGMAYLQAHRVGALGGEAPREQGEEKDGEGSGHGDSRK